MQFGGGRKTLPLLAVIVGALGLVAACTGGSDGGLVGPGSDAAGASSSDAASSSSGVDASTTGPTAAPTTTTTMLSTPTAIEATLVDPVAAWPVAGVTPGGARTTFADGTDNQLLYAIYQPVLPTVPHATATAGGGQYTVKVDGYEFADEAAAAAWVGTFAGYQAVETADLPGNIHVERHPQAAPPAGWSGYVVDALYLLPSGASWQRTSTLLRQHGARVFVVSIRWFGDPAAGVPDPVSAIGALAGAQDAFLASERIGPVTPGSRATGGPARLGLAELGAPWGALLSQPDVDPAAGSQVLTADTPDALPTGARPDGATAVAARVACGAKGCPVFSVVSKFPDAAAAVAAAARWALPDGHFGPLDEVAFPPGATAFEMAPVDAAAVPGAAAFTATVSDGTTSYQAGAGWFARGDTVFGVFTVYGAPSRNAEVVLALLTAHAARLTALGIV